MELQKNSTETQTQQSGHNPTFGPQRSKTEEVELKMARRKGRRNARQFIQSRKRWDRSCSWWP